MLEGGQAWAWNSLPSILLFGGGALVLVAFLLVERRAAEPILPLWVFTRRLVLVVSISVSYTHLDVYKRQGRQGPTSAAISIRPS